MSEQDFTESSGSFNGDSGSSGTKEQVQNAAQNAASKTQDVVRKQVDERSTQVGEEVSSVAEELRSVSEHLRQSEEGGRGARLAEQAADRAETVGNYLRDSDADKLLSDAESFGRRQPWLVLGGGVLLGIAAARFLKASSQQRYESGQSRPSTASAPTRPEPAVAEPQMPVEPVGAAAPATGSAW
jgi:hypothetical protein